MRFSTKSRYALQMLLDMAVFQSKGNVKIKDMSIRQGISIKYLEQIIADLNKAGLVTGERGPQGGYRLSVPPEEITAKMIVDIMDGPAQSQIQSQNQPQCSWIGMCVDLGLIEKINKSVDDMMEGITIADLIDFGYQQKLMYILDEPEYFI